MTRTFQIKKADKTALVFGSSGLVGSALLDLLLLSDHYSRVVVFVRKNLDVSHPKLYQVVVDFDNLDASSDFINGDDLFICLGTTMAKAGSKKAFYLVDYTYCYNTAKIAERNKVSQVLLISSMGADETSLFYYTKVKGELERDIQKIKFWSIRILRPSLLLGNRKENKLREKIFGSLISRLSFLFFGPIKRFKPIKASKVAEAMIVKAQELNGGIEFVSSTDLEQIALEN